MTLKWVLILWGLGGPQVAEVYDSEELCNAVADHDTISAVAAVKICARWEIDPFGNDVVIYTPGRWRAQDE